jgi:hypothetical protein
VGFELRALWLHNRCMLDYWQQTQVALARQSSEHLAHKDSSNLHNSATFIISCFPAEEMEAQDVTYLDQGIAQSDGEMRTLKPGTPPPKSAAFRTLSCNLCLSYALERTSVAARIHWTSVCKALVRLLHTPIWVEK